MASNRLKRLRSIGDILASDEMVGIVRGLASDIASNVSDPNPAVVATLRTQVFITTGGRAARRAVGQVGIAPSLAGVEAKRGPLARAVGATRA